MERQEYTRMQDDRYRPQKAQILLDGLIIYSRELGELGKQLERLLRLRGVRASVDPVYPIRYH